MNRILSAFIYIFKIFLLSAVKFLVAVFKVGHFPTHTQKNGYSPQEVEKEHPSMLNFGISESAPERGCIFSDR